MRITKATVAVIFAVLMLGGSAAAQARRPKKSAKPVTWEDLEPVHPIKLQGLLDALRIGGLSQAELIKRVEERRIDFVVTPAAEAALREAGASDALIRVVLPAGPTPADMPDTDGTSCRGSRTKGGRYNNPHQRS